MSGEELPEGWASIRAEEACTLVQSGGTPKGKPFTPIGSVPFLKVYNIVDQRVSFEYRPQFIPRSVHEKELGRSIVLPGDVLMNIVGPPLGKIALVPDTFPEWNINQAIVSFRPKPLLNSSFLYYWLCDGREIKRIENEFRGSTGQSNISLSQARAFELAVAPLPEQRRIVEKVEALLEQVKRMKGRLERVSAVLKRFRQSVLAAACSGELTAEWRKQNSSRACISVKDIASHLPHAERRRTRATSESLEADQRALADGQSALPSGWMWFPLDALASRITDGTHQPPPLATSGIPFMLIGNIEDGRIAWDRVSKWVSQETYETLTSKCRPERGDILYTAVGATYGQALAVEWDFPFVFQRHIALVKPLHDLIDTRYLTLWLNAPATYARATELARGVAQPTVVLGDIKAFPVPLPPLPEQHEIVRQVNRLFALAETIERRVNIAKARVEKLPQAILSKAFSGELVPTEAELARLEGRTYESAEALLARVQNEPAKTNTATKPARKRGGAKKMAAD